MEGEELTNLEFSCPWASLDELSGAILLRRGGIAQGLVPSAATGTTLAPVLRWAPWAVRETAPKDGLPGGVMDGWNDAGAVLTLSFDDAVHYIECDLDCAVRAAAEGYRLVEECVPSCDGPLFEQFWDAVGGYDGTQRLGIAGCSWEEVMRARIKETWRTRDPRSIWLDDKVAQVVKTEELAGFGRALHLPLYAHALTDDTSAEDALRDRARDFVARGESFVVKPRHGANSCHVSIWSSPRADQEARVLQSIDDALTGRDSTWEKECWQLSQVPRGAVLQPLYSIAFPVNHGARLLSRSAPLELKVQVLFGEIVGGTLNTHPQHLWVTSGGAIQIWDAAELRAQGHTRCRNIDKHYGQSLPPGIMEVLQRVLRQDWSLIRLASERLATRAGLDELRVDWLLGDDVWGPRVGELTYMGAGSRLTRPLSARLARAYAAGHLSCLGCMEFTESPGPRPLWPPRAEPLAPDPRIVGNTRGTPPRRLRARVRPFPGQDS
mmetsp:Transcript_96311/g.272309  ORF Transcript_96311/g.272309 Transcript_96311/m.272309 type:complete len:494 (-) Transcript_96311:182-1663(-)